MTPANAKIVFFDIDDTLYIKEQDRIPDSVSVAFHALKDKGIHIAIATGRSFCVFPSCLHQLIDDVGIDIFVTINGQYNICQNHIMDFPISPNELEQMRDFLTKQRTAFGYMTHDEIICFSDTPDARSALSSLHVSYRVMDFSSFDPTQNVYQVLAFSKHELDHLPANLKSVRWHTTGMDILPKHSNKTNGMCAVLDNMGLSMADAAAFGDGLNDIEMLSSVGFGVAMGNAYDETKAVAHHVCPRHDDDGIFKGLKALGII